jgi:hypothetical protein
MDPASIPYFAEIAQTLGAITLAAVLYVVRGLRQTVTDERGSNARALDRFVGPEQSLDDSDDSKLREVGALRLALRHELAPVARRVDRLAAKLEKVGERVDSLGDDVTLLVDDADIALEHRRQLSDRLEAAAQTGAHEIVNAAATQ